MRKLSMILILVLAAMLPFGCTTAQKPAPAKPKTQVTPGVKTVTFSSIDPVRAPDSVQLLLEKNKAKNTASLANLGNQKIYVMATSPMNKLRLKKVTETITTTGQSQLRVVIERTGNNTPNQNSDLAPSFLAHLKLNNAPDAVSFEYIPYQQTPNQTANRTTKGTTAPRRIPAPAPQAVSITVNEPKSGDDVQSPFTVSGTVSGKTDRVRVRLFQGTRILDSKEVQVNTSNQRGSFEQTVQYEKPATPTAAVLEVFAPGIPGNTVSLPLTLN